MSNQHLSSTEKNSPSELDRRQFMTASAGAIAATMLAASSSSIFAANKDSGMIYRALGRTGERVSVIGLGGWHIGQPSLSERESIELIRKAIDSGITFMDNCWDYNEAASQVRMGKALPASSQARSECLVHRNEPITCTRTEESNARSSHCFLLPVM